MINKKLYERNTPVVLYDNPSGTNGNVTLSDSSANYEYIEIFYKDNFGQNKYNSTKIYQPNGKNALLINLFMQNYESASQGFALTKAIISGTSITREDVAWWTDTGTHVDTGILITRVIGYKSV